MIYLIKWALALTLLYSLYGLTLRRETFHTLNRAVLLIILVASAVIPYPLGSRDVDKSGLRTVGECFGCRFRPRRNLSFGSINPDKAIAR